MRVKRFTASVVTACVVLVALLAGCGSPTKTPIGGRQTSLTTTPTGAATLGPTPLPTAPLYQQAACTQTIRYNLGTFTQVDGVIVSPVGLGLDNPNEQVPDRTPSKPIQIPTNGTNNPFPDSPAVNPRMGEGVAGIIFLVCGGSDTATHTLQSVRVSIASFTPYTGQLNTWQPCDGVYTKRNGYSPAGCGADAFYDELLHATFSSTDGAGATVTAVQTGTSSVPQAGGKTISPLPVTLASGSGVTIDVGITVPTAPGTYTFAFSLVVDGAAPVTFGKTDPLLFAPVARSWSGQGCTTPAMQALIPASAGQDDQFICPLS